MAFARETKQNTPLDTTGELESFPGSVIPPYLAAVEELVWTRQWGLEEDK